MLTWISNTQGAHSVVFSTGSTQLNVVASIVVNTSFSQHSIVFDFTFPTKQKSNEQKSRL